MRYGKNSEAAMADSAWLGTSYLHPDDIPEARFARLMMSRDEYGEMVRERAARDALAPDVGDPAPDFSAHCLSREGARTGEMFRLSAALGRPIGLVFGSYT